MVKLKAGSQTGKAADRHRPAKRRLSDQLKTTALTGRPMRQPITIIVETSDPRGGLGSRRRSKAARKQILHINAIRMRTLNSCIFGQILYFWAKYHYFVSRCHGADQNTIAELLLAAQRRSRRAALA